tara:strand:+ start:1436 stop:1663 length:228 start_codon:yes stop_codon:yes gene_type:complete
MALPKHMQRNKLSASERQKAEDIYLKPYRKRKKGKFNKPSEHGKVPAGRWKNPRGPKHLHKLLESMMADGKTFGK